ncbi:MAG TPA: DUF998 domain-containing protein [Anaerolineales bacterium]|nr:DUF998 domain-containing protein [Anaerolineales bacterium]
MKKTLMLCGIAAAVVYVGTIILGGFLRPGYSHISMAISELVADGAPNRSLLSSFFLLYNIFVSIFGAGLFLNANSQPSGRVSGMIGSLALILVGVAGILMELAFPQESGGTATTFAGSMHFVMAGVASLGTMVAILMQAFWFRNIPALKGQVAYSFISVGIVFLSGGSSAVAMANHSPLFGLIERITIFTFILWMFVIARKMSQLEEELPQQTSFEIAELKSKGN